MPRPPTSRPVRLWAIRGALGIAVLAALGLGRVISDAWPTGDSPEASFVRHGQVGDTVRLRYADVSVDRVAATGSLATVAGGVRTSGIWLVVDLTVVARQRPLAAPRITITDASGRIFSPDNRSGYLFTPAQTGIPWHVRVPVEMPQGDLVGLVLRLTGNTEDNRRDDVASIDLGIDRSAAERLEQEHAAVEVRQGGPDPLTAAGVSS